MTQLALLTGDGQLHVNDKNTGAVTYSVKIWRDGETTKADGVLSGNTHLIGAAHAYRIANLELASGEHVKIHVHDANMVRGLFTVEGPIPKH